MKSKHLKLIIIGAIVVLALVARLVIIVVNHLRPIPEPTTTSQPTTNNQQPTTSLANPASTNCVAKGGQTVIQTKADGSQYGLCMFDDNRACEEWAMMRGDCPVGGMKTTGYDTIAQKFCAWAGGETVAQENAVCTFKDGSKCDDEAFYEGSCQAGNKVGQ